MGDNKNGKHDKKDDQNLDAGKSHESHRRGSDRSVRGRGTRVRSSGTRSTWEDLRFDDDASSGTHQIASSGKTESVVEKGKAIHYDINQPSTSTSSDFQSQSSYQHGAIPKKTLPRSKHTAIPKKDSTSSSDDEDPVKRKQFSKLPSGKSNVREEKRKNVIFYKKHQRDEGSRRVESGNDPIKVPKEVEQSQKRPDANDKNLPSCSNTLKRPLQLSSLAPTCAFTYAKSESSESDGEAVLAANRIPLIHLETEPQPSTSRRHEQLHNFGIPEIPQYCRVWRYPGQPNEPRNNVGGFAAGDNFIGQRRQQLGRLQLEQDAQRRGDNAVGHQQQVARPPIRGIFNDVPEDPHPYPMPLHGDILARMRRRVHLPMDPFEEELGRILIRVLWRPPSPPVELRMPVGPRRGQGDIVGIHEHENEPVTQTEHYGQGDSEIPIIIAPQGVVEEEEEDEEDEENVDAVQNGIIAGLPEPPLDFFFNNVPDEQIIDAAFEVGQDIFLEIPAAEESSHDDNSESWDESPTQVIERWQQRYLAMKNESLRAQKFFSAEDLRAALKEVQVDNEKPSTSKYHEGQEKFFEIPTAKESWQDDDTESWESSPTDAIEQCTPKRITVEGLRAALKEVQVDKEELSTSKSHEGQELLEIQPAEESSPDDVSKKDDSPTHIIKQWQQRFLEMINESQHTHEPITMEDLHAALTKVLEDLEQKPSTSKGHEASEKDQKGSDEESTD